MAKSKTHWYPSHHGEDVRRSRAGLPRQVTLRPAGASGADVVRDSGRVDHSTRTASNRGLGFDITFQGPQPDDIFFGTSMSPIRTRWRQSSRRAMSSFPNHSKIPMMACVDSNSRTLTATFCFSVVLVHGHQFKLGFCVAELVVKINDFYHCVFVDIFRKAMLAAFEELHARSPFILPDGSRSSGPLPRVTRTGREVD
jgi:hypothetical protein